MSRKYAFWAVVLSASNNRQPQPSQPRPLKRPDGQRRFGKALS
jgi:hypothetical protein